MTARDVLLDKAFHAWRGDEIALVARAWTSPVVTPGFAFTALVPSWNARTPPGSWLEVLVRVTSESGERSGWFVLARWCSQTPGEGGAIARTTVQGQRTGLTHVDDDTLRAAPGRSLLSWQLRVVVHEAPDTPRPPADGLSISLVGAVAWLVLDEVGDPSPATDGTPVELAVPALSQTVHRGHYPEWDAGGEAWCSPTSTAMVLRYWGVGPGAAETAWVEPPADPEVDHAARGVYDQAYGGCGNWPFNTAYAGQFGLEAFVTVLRSLSEAQAFVAVGIPLVLSVSFTRDELDGAGYDTKGHLLVLVGFTADGDVIVNDPASHLLPDNAQVRVVYDRAQFERVWLRGTGGMAYVIRPPDHALPAG